MKKILTLIILICAILFIFFYGEELGINLQTNNIGNNNNNDNSNSNNSIIDNSNMTTIKVANWNLQIFGVSKAEDENLMNFYADTIDEYDIIFIQEIRDKSQESFPKLCAKLPQYNCEVSSRAGRSSSKEQTGIIYKKGIEIVEFIDYNPDEQDRWERPPIEVTFKIGKYTFTAYNIHTKPEDVQMELHHLESIVENDGNVMIIGDLNAECSYYNNDKEIEFDSWTWIIDDSIDTTVSKTDCAYDRIIVNNDLNDEISGYGIFTENINKSVSDHYLIWSSLQIDGNVNITYIIENNKTIINNNKTEYDNTTQNKNINTTQTIIKMSSSQICHNESSPYYDSITNYENYNTMEECLNDGGRNLK